MKSYEYRIKILDTDIITCLKELREAKFQGTQRKLRKKYVRLHKHRKQLQQILFSKERL